MHVKMRGQRRRMFTISHCASDCFTGFVPSASLPSTAAGCMSRRHADACIALGRVSVSVGARHWPTRPDLTASGSHADATSGLGGFSFSTLDHHEAGDLTLEEGAQELRIVPEGHTPFDWPFEPCM